MFNTHIFKKQNSNSKGFTIIELLVVIAIIGLISSVVLVGMKGSTGKARISKNLEFSQMMLNAIGVDAVGLWSFDEGVDNTCSAGEDVCDKSGYGNHGTFHGDPEWVSGEKNTPHWYVNEDEGKWALDFDGNDYINYGIANSLEMGTGAITVEHWIKPSAWSGYKSLFFGGAGGGGRGYGTHLQTGGSNFRYEVYGSTGGRQVFSVDIGIKVDKWNHIIAIFDGVNNEVKCYLNGEEEHGSSISDPGDVQNAHNFVVGSYNGTAWFYEGLVDEVRVYARALDSTEIQQHYADGAEKHQLVINN